MKRNKKFADVGEMGRSAMEKKLVGKISHYFSKIGVAAVELSSALRVGDKIRVEYKDGTSVIEEETVTSLQIHHQNVREAKPGDDVAIRLTKRVHDGNLVYKIA